MDKIISQLDSVYQAVYENQHSDFYRKLYDQAGGRQTKILSLKDWSRVPFVTKKDLQGTPLFERVFMPIKECDTLRVSSGTSGAQPVFTLRNQGYSLDAVSSLVTITGAFMVSNTMHLVEGPYRRLPGGVPVISCDMSDMELGIKMMVGTEINCLDMWVHAFDVAIPLLQKYDLVRQIDVLMYYGEKISVGQYEKLRSVFPEAIFCDIYSCSEVHYSNNFESVNDYDPEFGSVFSIGDMIYPEIIDLDSSNIISEPGKSGELVLTLLKTDGFPTPAVRFRTGDLAMYPVYHDDYRQRKLVMMGRVELSAVRIPGGQVQLLECNRVVSLFTELIEHDFELHYYSSKKNVKAYFELLVLPKSDFDESDFSVAFMKELRVSPTRTYQDGVAHGFYEPIVCKKVEKLDRTANKKKQLIKHD